MNIEEIRTVLVIGAGTMGQQIALQCAMHGYTVRLYDVAEDKLAEGRAQVERFARRLAEGGRLPQAELDATLARIHPTTDPQEAAQADLLSESVPEDPQLKGTVLAQFNALCPAHTIFTTNTSSLLPSMFAAASGRPAQFAALHFHNYVWDSNVVDIMPHPGTAPETVELLEAFARSIDQIPILLNKENFGYVFNAMYTALNREAISLAARGVASPQDIDRAWMGVMKMPIGPFGMLDQVGLETVWHINQFWAERLDDEQLKTNTRYLKKYVDKGWLGIKTGKGFYEYPDPAFARPDFLD